MAMLINADLSIPFPRPLVYITYRDNLRELVPYMPNVHDIEVKSRRCDNQLIYCINFWRGGGQIPLALRAILSEAMLSWSEYQTWDESNFTQKWQIETQAFTKAVFCRGQNRFLSKNGTTVIENRTELRINPESIEGVPQFLKKQIASTLEKFLGQKIVANLIQTSQGIQKYLEQTVTNPI